jgi:hypothetical protein
MSRYRTVKVSKLTRGDTLVEPVFDESQTKLLGSGFALSEELISGLAERGVIDVVVQNRADRNQKHARRVVLPSSSSMRPENLFDASHAIVRSCQCGSVIRIHPPAADLPVAAWICKTCGAAYFGGANASATSGVEPLVADGTPLASGDQSEPLDESTSMNANVSPSGSEIDSLTGKDRRREKRHSIGVPVVAVPLRADFSIAGEAVRMTTRDISQSGIALTYTRFSDVPYYVIDFTAAGIELLQVPLKVLRVTPSGSGYEVAGKFIARVRCANRHNKFS